VTSSPTLGQVLREASASSTAAALRLSPHQWKTVRALAACRTSALGGQLFHCTACQREHFVAHSCRNRHCPQCQGTRAVDWLEQQEAALLPIPYFHLVFTLPHTLNGLLRQNRPALFKLLFAAASQTLLEFGEGRLRAQIGITAVLHTWSQTLLDHYHLHCIVTGGGVALEGTRWVSSSAHYLFPVQALSVMFRGKFLAGLKTLFDAGQLEFHGQLAALAKPSQFAGLVREAAAPKWVVYAKRPFAGPKQVLAYLSHYTHRVAISNRRLISADGQHVIFAYKDYADGAKQKTMMLSAQEFVRRFCLHVLPERFVKIRHYGLLGNRQRQQRLAYARQLLGVSAPTRLEETAAAKEKGTEPLRALCPFCQRPSLILVREVAPQRAARPIVVLDSS
jgi:putative transposase/transposase-like zinc-binding protein